jgi:hypothetical protein
MPQQDYRARLQPKKRNDINVLGPADPSNILNPLHATNGVLFPYTPSVTSGNVAEYDNTGFIHTNYGYNAYIRSYTKPLSITAEFTAQTTDEALYLLAVIHFFRSVTKSYFGINPYQKAGTPPPVLLFDYLGEFQYNRVPVLPKTFDFTYDPTIDYVAVNTAGYSIAGPTVQLPAGNKDGWSYVPTHLVISLELDTQYIPIKLRDEFNLDEFRSGKLVGRGYI